MQHDHNSLAAFDRWLTRSTEARQARPACSPSPSRYLIGPDAGTVTPVSCAAGPTEILRAAHATSPEDWLGLLADEAQAGRRGLSQPWRLALWRTGAAGPRWIGDKALNARPGQSAAALRAAALEQAVAALWAQGWRLVDAAESASA